MLAAVQHKATSSITGAVGYYGRETGVDLFLAIVGNFHSGRANKDW